MNEEDFYEPDDEKNWKRSSLVLRLPRKKPADILRRGPLFWDYFWLDEAEKWASASKDPSTKVGAVLVDQHNVLVSTGFNGFPRGVDDTAARYNNRELKYKFVMHAEANAVINAKGRAEGCRLYIYPSFGLPHMCNECAKVVIQAGVCEVIGYAGGAITRWAESLEIARQMCVEAGVHFREVPLRTAAS